MQKNADWSDLFKPLTDTYSTGLDLIKDMGPEAISALAALPVLGGFYTGRTAESWSAPDERDLKNIQHEAFNKILEREIASIKRRRQMRKEEEKAKYMSPERALKIT